MKKILFFVLSFLFAANALAQSVRPVSKVSKENKSFVAFVDDKEHSISAADYLKMKGACKDYFFIEYKGSEKGSFAIFAHKDDFTNELLTVDSLGVGDDKVEVYFTNGSVYQTASKAWASVLVGQKVQHVVINNAARNFERYASLVSEPENFVCNFAKVKEAKVSSPAPKVKSEKVDSGTLVATSPAPKAKEVVITESTVAKKSKQRISNFGNVKLIEE